MYNDVVTSETAYKKLTSDNNSAKYSKIQRFIYKKKSPITNKSKNIMAR